MDDEAVEKMGNEAATAHGVENETADQIAKGEEFEKRGDEKTGDENTKRGLYAAAACFYRSAQSWNKAGAAYVKMARLPFQHQDPDAIPRNLVAAADCYMITSPEEALICLHEAVPLLPQNKTNCTITSRAGRIFQELGELRELEQNFEEAVECFELSYKLYECCGGFNMRGKGCRMKVAKLSALLGQYSMASEMFEEIVKRSVNGVIHNYNDVQMLLNACLCQLCLGGVFALTNSLQRYKELLRNFSCSNEYQFLEDLAVSFVEKDIRMFINDHVVWNVNALPWLVCFPYLDGSREMPIPGGSCFIAR